MVLLMICLKSEEKLERKGNMSIKDLKQILF